MTGELIVIWKALQIVAEDGLKKIFTNSLSACKLLEKNYENYIVVDMLNLINSSFDTLFHLGTQSRGHSFQ